MRYDPRHFDTSKLSKYANNRRSTGIDISDFLKEICEPYAMIANAKGVQFSFTTSENLLVTCGHQNCLRKSFQMLFLMPSPTPTPENPYPVRISGELFVIENECTPIPQEHLRHIFEHSIDQINARNREDGVKWFRLVYCIVYFDKSKTCLFVFLPMKNQLGMNFTINL